MYSPFVNKRGKPIYIRNVKYEHLEQLKECDEGHHLEYKKLLEDGGKNQLAKEIASFANCEGGWLIVGIDDKSKDVIPVEKEDYSQRIGVILTRVSPMPEIETKFISIPGDNKKGVLLVYIYEGRYAPYVCNGSIYLRSGSSKEPIKMADRGNIEYLLNRSKAYDNELRGFFSNSFFYAKNDIIHDKTTIPIANIYLKNISSKEDARLQKFKDIEKVKKLVLEEFPIFEQIQHTMNSILFIHKAVIPNSNNVTYVFELFYDWSCKVHLPLGVSDTDEINSFKSLLISLGYLNKDIDALKCINGTTTMGALFSGLIIFNTIAKKYKLKEQDYCFMFEIENAGENVLVFEGEAFNQYIQENGIPYAHNMLNKSPIIYLRDRPKMKFRDIPTSLVVDLYAPAFGYDNSKISNIWKQSNSKYL